MSATFSAEAMALHDKAHVIDLHVDSFLLRRLIGYNFLKRHRAPLPYGAIAGHVDLPRMIEGGIDTIGFGVVVYPRQAAFDRWQNALYQMDLFARTCDRSEGRLKFSGSADEAVKAKEAGISSGFLGLEGAHLLGDDLENLKTAWAEGVRYITLTHFSANKAAVCAKGMGKDHKAGLSAWGVELVERMNAMGMLVDLAHINKPGFIQAARHSDVPCFVSHTGISGVYPIWRNLDGDMMRALVEKEGMAAIIFAPQFLSGRIRDTAQCLFRHIDHIVQKYGEDYVGLGSDFDGFILSTPLDLRDAAGMPAITQIMIEHGYGEERIKKILGGNFLRVWRAVEARAEKSA